MFPLAHLGHWYIQLIYLAPVLALVILSLVNKLCERRQDDAGGTRDRSDQP